MTPWVALLLLGLTQPSDPNPLAIPPGSSQAFQETALAALRELEAKRYDRADVLATRLPHARVQVRANLDQVPPERRAEYQRGIEQGWGAWREVMPSLQFAWVQSVPQLLIGFEPDLGLDSVSGQRRPAATFLSDEPSEARVELVIGLLKGVPPQVPERQDVMNEVVAAIGAYFGLPGDVPFGLGVMGRVQGPEFSPRRFSAGDVRLATQNLAFAQALRKAIANRESVVVRVPQIATDPTALSAEPVSEGDLIRWNVQVTNHGDGELVYNAVGDCGCILVPREPRTLAPGETGSLPVLANTKGWPGPFHKAVLLFTNDPAVPIRRIAIESHVRPRFRFLGPAIDGRLWVDKSGGTYTTYLSLDQAKPLVPEAITVSGVAADPTFEPWEGELADPELGEGLQPRVGLKISVPLPANLPEGEVPLTIAVRTKDPDFPRIVHTVFLQTGILPSPKRVYFGEVGDEPQRAWFTLRRPGKPFRILAVESDTDHIGVELGPELPSGQRRIFVTYDGKAPIGDLRARVTVRTDDPDEPTVTVPVLAVVG